MRAPERGSGRDRRPWETARWLAVVPQLNSVAMLCVRLLSSSPSRGRAHELRALWSLVEEKDPNLLGKLHEKSHLLRTYPTLLHVDDLSIFRLHP